MSVIHIMFTTPVFTIGFNKTAYSVSEDAGSVYITLSVQNEVLDRDVIVTLSTVNGTAMCESLKPLHLNVQFHWHHCQSTPCVHYLISPAGMDYEAVTTNLTFNVSMPTQMVTILIFDDLIVENDKSFRVTLATFDTAVTQRLQTASVTIRDNDSKLHCSQYTYITV